jgi:protein-L-isoaspartate(D-aspartate) O-methyltransferase
VDEHAARERMVRTQLTARGVTDQRVLDAMGEIPRHLFVPAGSAHQAYDDRPLPIGEGQTISQPYMVAVMTQVLGVQPDDHVLEIGTGSGYQTAILARLARDVISIERHAPLADRARDVLTGLEIQNVTVIVADGTEGWPPAAPYDRVLVTAGAPSVPESLQQQLAPGGRLAIPVGPAGLQHLTIIDRTADGFETRLGEACVFVPLVGRHGWSA